MKTKRKLLSVLMTLAMVVSMIPAFGVTPLYGQAKVTVESHSAWISLWIIRQNVQDTMSYSSCIG